VDCQLIDADLIGFHFAALDPAARARVEGHLPACARCLHAYLQIKRLVEGGEEASERPSELARARLRAQVASELRQRRSALKPMLVGAAGLAVGVLLTLWAARPLTHRDRAQPMPGSESNAPGRTSAPEVDSARPTPANLNYL
jgi:anti-sigma factor RsiW